MLTELAQSGVILITEEIIHRLTIFIQENILLNEISLFLNAIIGYPRDVIISSISPDFVDLLIQTQNNHFLSFIAYIIRISSRYRNSMIKSNMFRAFARSLLDHINLNDEHTQAACNVIQCIALKTKLSDIYLDAAPIFFKTALSNSTNKCDLFTTGYYIIYGQKAHFFEKIKKMFLEQIPPFEAYLEYVSTDTNFEKVFIECIYVCTVFQYVELYSLGKDVIKLILEKAVNPETQNFEYLYCLIFEFSKDKAFISQLIERNYIEVLTRFALEQSIRIQEVTGGILAKLVVAFGGQIFENVELSELLELFEASVLCEHKKYLREIDEAIPVLFAYSLANSEPDIIEAIMQNCDLINSIFEKEEAFPKTYGLIRQAEGL